MMVRGCGLKVIVLRGYTRRDHDRGTGVGAYHCTGDHTGGLRRPPRSTATSACRSAQASAGLCSRAGFGAVSTTAGGGG